MRSVRGGVVTGEVFEAGGEGDLQGAGVEDAGHEEHVDGGTAPRVW